MQSESLANQYFNMGLDDKNGHYSILKAIIILTIFILRLVQFGEIIVLRTLLGGEVGILNYNFIHFVLR